MTARVEYLKTFGWNPSKMSDHAQGLVEELIKLGYGPVKLANIEYRLIAPEPPRPLSDAEITALRKLIR